MIIKFQEMNRWVVFGEVDHVEYEEIKGNSDGQEVVASRKVLTYGPPNSLVVGNYNEISFFTKNMNEATVVHACSPIYLMNDQGRTIQTI